MGCYVSPPDPNTFYHHGIIGMKWGIRRYQPYPSGQRVKGGKEIGEAKKSAMSKSQAKEYSQQQKRTGAAYKVLKRNSKLVVNARQSVRDASKAYDKAINKQQLPWNKKKRRAEIERTAETLNNVLTSFNKKETDRKNSEITYNQEYSKLVNMTNKLLKTTSGIDASKLSSRQKTVGKDWVVTTLSNAKKPLLTGKYEREWERERRKG